MAINKVQFGSNTLMDITDTTTETEDVIEGKVFYAKNGVRSVGNLGDATQSTHGLMSATDKEKLDSITAMTGATSSANGASGLVPSPTTEDVDKFLAGDGTYKSGGLPMVILSYGKSVWDDFINAYNNHVIVYCRASSNSNPATGAQGRMAFMAYVNNGDNPTEVEFQYYRSMSSHSSTQMGDQVFIYKLSKTGGWSVTVREASIKEISASATGNLSVSYSSNKVTLSGGLPTVTTTDNDKMLKVVNGVWTIVDPNTYSKTETDAAIAQSTANRLLYVDASLTLANDSSAPKEYEIALSSYVPSGYVIQGVTACVKSGSAYYSLPWTDNGLTQYLNIQRIVGTSVWLRNKSDGWGTVTVRLSVAIGKT